PERDACRAGRDRAGASRVGGGGGAAPERGAAAHRASAGRAVGPLRHQDGGGGRRGDGDAGRADRGGRVRPVDPHRNPAGGYRAHPRGSDPGGRDGTGGPGGVRPDRAGVGDTRPPLWSLNRLRWTPLPSTAYASSVRLLVQ